MNRDELRTNGIDIEVTVVINVVKNTPKHTGTYRYLVSKWDKDGFLIKNHYSNNLFNSYNEALDDAIEYANEIVDS